MSECVVAVLTPEGIPLALNRSKPEFPPYWMLPGRKSVEGELPKRCAVRALQEVTGICLEAPQDVCFVASRRSSDQILFGFRANLAEVPAGILEVGSEGEEIVFFSLVELGQMMASGDKIFSDHIPIIAAALK